MKIGFDAKRAFNNHTGLGNYSRFVIGGLIRQYPEHEYFLFTPSVKEEYRDFAAGHKNVSIVSPDSMVGKIFSSLWRTYAIPEMCRQLGLDVFHGLSNELPVGIDKFSGKKIVTIHDLIFLRYPDYYGNIDRYIYTKKFRYACTSSDLVIAASEQTKNDVIRYFGTEAGKISVGYQDCGPQFYHEVSGQDKASVRTLYGLQERYILCVGTIEKRKNQLTVLKAFKELDQPGVQLVFVGRYTPYVHELHAQIKSDGLEHRVKLLNQVPSGDLPAIYQSAGVFVYASEFEGFGIPVLEGMRSGVPVIAAGTSSLTEVGGDAALYFSFDDAGELTQKLRLVLGDKQEAARLVKKGREQSARFEAPRLIGKLLDLYR